MKEETDEMPVLTILVPLELNAVLKGFTGEHIQLVALTAEAEEVDILIGHVS